MQAISRMDPAQPLMTRSNAQDQAWAERVVSAGRWMTVLGIVRLASATAAWIADFTGSQPNQSQPLTLETTWQSLVEAPPLVAIGMLWPVALGILLCRKHWPELLRPASVTFFLLAIIGVIKAMSDWSLGSGGPVTIGSFRIDRSELTHPTPIGLSLALLGAAQLLAELWVAARSRWMLRRAHRPDGSDSGEFSIDSEESTLRTRSIVTACCWFFSLAFLSLIVRVPAIPKLNDVISQSPFLRELLLMNDRKAAFRRPRPRPSNTETLAEEHQVQDLVNRAITLWGEKHYTEASAAYEKVLSVYQNSERLRDQQSRGNLAMLHNNLAWLLVTRPDPRPDDPEKAVEHAQLALASSPSDGTYWNTLATAQYRAKNWQSAKDALLRSMELRGDGDGYDWILFSLIYAQTGRKDRSREWFDKAARWRKEFRLWDPELYRFEVEAAKLLGLPDPAPPERLRPSFRNHDEHGHATFKGRGMPVNPNIGEPKMYRRPR